MKVQRVWGMLYYDKATKKIVWKDGAGGREDMRLEEREARGLD